MFFPVFLILKTPIETLKNRLRRLRKKGSKKNDDDPIVRKAVDRVWKLISKIAHSNRFDHLSNEEKKKVVEYLKSLSYGLEWDFAYFFERECIPYSYIMNADDIFYLDRHTDMNLEETDENIWIKLIQIIIKLRINLKYSFLSLEFIYDVVIYEVNR